MPTSPRMRTSMDLFEEVLKSGCQAGLTLPGCGTIRLFATTSVIFLDKKGGKQKRCQRRPTVHVFENTI
jgi:hypothetical protein